GGQKLDREVVVQVLAGQSRNVQVVLRVRGIVEDALAKGVIGFLDVIALLFGDAQQAEQLRTRVPAGPQGLERGDTTVIPPGAKVGEREPVVAAELVRITRRQAIELIDRRLEELRLAQQPGELE